MKKITSMVLSLFFICPGISHATQSAVLSALTPEELVQLKLQPLVIRIEESAKRIRYVRHDLLQIEGMLQSKSDSATHNSDLVNLYNIKLIMCYLTEISHQLETQSELLGISILIEQDFKASYYRRRLLDLFGVRERIQYTVDEIKISYGRIGNSAALHTIDRAKDLLGSSLKFLDKTIDILKSFRDSES